MSDTLVERLREICRGGEKCLCSAREGADRIEQLERELAEARRDAERYRFLRDAPGFEISVMEIDDDGDEEWICGYPPEELDAAIDAAMKEKN